MAKAGRPKSENPLDFQISIRFTQEEYRLLKKCAAENNLTIAQTVRKSVEKMLKSKR